MATYYQVPSGKTYTTPRPGSVEVSSPQRYSAPSKTTSSKSKIKTTSSKNKIRTVAGKRVTEEQYQQLKKQEEEVAEKTIAVT